ncbi:MAG: glucosylceramidase [Actinomycetota bacterium]|nr:glucosylceramidase [Actinomycetota bacterium]
MPLPTVAQVYETTQSLSKHLTRMRPRRFTRGPGAASVVIPVIDSLTYQRMTGFGASMTDSSAWLLHNQLTPQAGLKTMRALFSPAGIHLNFVRIPMGATDFTALGAPYSYDDLAPGQTDPGLRQFSITHDQAYILPALREMRLMNPTVSTLASPWSPPPWMKANDAFNNEFLAGTVLPRDYGALAHYFVKFIRAYTHQGVSIDAVTPMNEPRSLSPWPGAAFLPADSAPWTTRFLVPALRAAHLHTKIFGLDDTSLADAELLLRSTARAALAGLAFHCYQGLGSMSALHAAYPNENLIVSECSPGIIPYAPAEAAIDATRNWASAVQLWNLALDPAGGPVQAPNHGCRGCRGLVTVSETTHTARYGRSYYQLGQLSKFVAPGAVRIASARPVQDFAPPLRGVTSGLDDVAFLNPDGTKVLVAYNHSSARISFALEYRHRFLSWSLPPAATVTFVWH